MVPRKCTLSIISASCPFLRSHRTRKHQNMHDLYEYAGSYSQSHIILCRAAFCVLCLCHGTDEELLCWWIFLQQGKGQMRENGEIPMMGVVVPSGGCAWFVQNMHLMTQMVWNAAAKDWMKINLYVHSICFFVESLLILMNWEPLFRSIVNHLITMTRARTWLIVFLVLHKFYTASSFLVTCGAMGYFVLLACPSCNGVECLPTQFTDKLAWSHWLYWGMCGHKVMK